ncbi:MAG: CDP-alcohol phosphatidyltransferase family protein [Chlamydiales bacterium]|nr:CDP-alcohol phosphatidyltransferase family protein [Chlamydiales bacterium]
MIDSYGRSLYQKWIVDPILKISFIHQLSPNQITFIGLFCGVISFFLIVLKVNIIAIIFLLLSGFFDTLDGSVARANNSVATTGSALDIFIDRMVESLVILGLYLQEPIARSLPCMLMLITILLCITSFLVVGIFTTNNSEKSFHYSPGIIERFEAFCFFIAMILFPKHFIWISYTFSFLVFLTATIRMSQFYRFSK